MGFVVVVVELMDYSRSHARILGLRVLGKVTRWKDRAPITCHQICSVKEAKHADGALALVLDWNVVNRRLLLVKGI